MADAAEQLENCACPLCGSGEAEATPYQRAPFHVRRCLACRLWFLSPRLPEPAMRAVYERAQYFAGDKIGGYVDYGRRERSLRRTFRRLLRRLARAGVTGGGVLEIGAGHGFFLDEAAPFFKRRVGTEMSATAAAIAARRADAVHVGSIDAVSAGERFDCIIACHVIEHIYAPVPFVQALAERLTPNGVIVLAAPDMAGFWRRILGKRWPSFKYPEHVTFYDAATLSLLLSKAGLAKARRLAYVHDFPLSEILAKLGLPRFGRAFDLPISLPATTICFMAGRAGGSA